MSKPNQVVVGVANIRKKNAKNINLLNNILVDCLTVSESFVVMRKTPVLVQRGHATTLPCWLEPSQSAEGVEVRWYRTDGFHSPVMLYRGKKFENGSQEASYAGRVSFGLMDTASGGLAAGDVSLKLVDVTLKDEGDYTCYVSSDQNHESQIIHLDVTREYHESGENMEKQRMVKKKCVSLPSHTMFFAFLETGNPLLLSAVWVEDNRVNVSCESGGWYPQPNLLWSDQKQVLTHKSLKYSNESSGLRSVHSWLLVSSPSVVSCSVGLSGEETKKASIRLDNTPQPSKQGKEKHLHAYMRSVFLFCFN